MLIPSYRFCCFLLYPSLSRRVNANSQRAGMTCAYMRKLIKKGEC